MNGRSGPQGAAPETAAKRSEAIIGQLELGEEPDTPPGLQRAIDNTDDQWRSMSMQALRHMAATGRTFSAFELSDELGLVDPDHPNRWGALFRRAHTAGLIEPVGYAQSRRPGRAGGSCRLWRGVR